MPVASPFAEAEEKETQYKPRKSATSWAARASVADDGLESEDLVCFTKSMPPEEMEDQLMNADLEVLELEEAERVKSMASMGGRSSRMVGYLRSMRVRAPSLLPQPRLSATEGTWEELEGELLGTFVLILGICSTSACVLRREADGTIGDLHTGTLFMNIGGALSWAVAFFVSFDSSKAHINPAVTLSFMLVDGFPFKKGLKYIVMQFFGAFLAAVCCWVLYMGFQRDDKYWQNFYHTTPSPETTIMQAFLAEIQATAMLVMGMKFLSTGGPPKPDKLVMGFGTGALVFFILLTMGYISGASLNPARELPPRMVRFVDSAFRGAGAEGTFDSWEWLAPTFGPMIGGPVGMMVYLACSAPPETRK